MSVYDHRAVFRTSEEISMQAFEGKVMLIVNTASKCGFTPQFKGLEWLNRKYKDQGLCVVGFPCNQFANRFYDRYVVYIHIFGLDADFFLWN